MKHATVRGCHVLSLEGSLTVAAAADVRRVLRKVLLDTTMPVICELAGVSSFSPAGLTVFPTAFAAAGGWPAVTLALAEPDAVLLDGLRLGGITRRVPVFPTIVSAAIADLVRWRPDVLSRSTVLPFTEHAAAEARAATDSFCQILGCAGDHLEDARLVASELVTNAVRHGRPPVILMLLASRDSLTVRVRDASPAPARLRQPYQEGGQGLALVEGVALSWISEPVPGDGKTVSARLSIARWAGDEPPVA